MTDQQPIAEAILAALNTALGSAATAYDRDEVPGTADNGWADAPVRCVVIKLYRRFTSTQRYGGDYTMPGYFLDTTYRARSIQDCRELRRIVCDALEGHFIGTLGPFCFNDESQPIADDADFGWTGTDTWTFI